MTDEKTIEDGFGGCWVKCDHPDCDLQVVRPGKVQCNPVDCMAGRESDDERVLSADELREHGIFVVPKHSREYNSVCYLIERRQVEGEVRFSRSRVYWRGGDTKWVDEIGDGCHYGTDRSAREAATEIVQWEKGPKVEMWTQHAKRVGITQELINAANLFVITYRDGTRRVVQRWSDWVYELVNNCESGNGVILSDEWDNQRAIREAEDGQDV